MNFLPQHYMASQPRRPSLEASRFHLVELSDSSRIWWCDYARLPCCHFYSILFL